MPSAGFLHSIYFLELMATIGTPMVSIGAYGKDILEATPVWKCPPRQLRGFLMLDESYFFPPRPFIASREGPLSSHLWVNLMFQSFHGRDSRLWREGRKESKHFLATPESPSNSWGTLGICPALYMDGFLLWMEFSFWLAQHVKSDDR